MGSLFLFVFTGLRELNLCGCIKVTDITLTHALNLQELQYLNLSHCQGVSRSHCFFFMNIRSLSTYICTSSVSYNIYQFIHPQSSASFHFLFFSFLLSLCDHSNFYISLAGWRGRPYKPSPPLSQFGGSHVSRLWPDDRSSDTSHLTSP